MSHIDIKRPHNLSLDKAQNVADDLARGLAEKFSIVYQWQGDVLNFQRSGVQGEITVNEDHVHIQAELGFLLSYLKPVVEREINQYLDEHFV
ncbi:MAG: polyhydroxyalkanoic acid synthase [Symploca sp. SIO2G7]|nr:polyhydroxyalkanoic acid synthase [Symploca sp. SIO2G7]